MERVLVSRRPLNGNVREVCTDPHHALLIDSEIPQFLHEAGFTSPAQSNRSTLQMIGITQPRRMAAISLAKRVAQELGTADPGDDDDGSPMSKSLVGFAIRFQDRTSKDTRIKFMTDGWLLREFVKASSQLIKDGKKLEDITDPRDPALLPQYSVLIIDEAHERSVRSDLVLGLAKRVQQRRRELHKAWKVKQEKEEGLTGGKEPVPLRIVIMSATLDAELFSDFFASTPDWEQPNGKAEAEEETPATLPAPILYVQGRTFEVKLNHLTQAVTDWIDAAKRQVLYLHLNRPLGSPTSGKGGGDILIFGTGAEEIESLAASLRQLADQLPDWAAEREKSGQRTQIGQLKIVPLYAALGGAASAQVFTPAPANTRKVVIATNIAETSVTIPGIRYVIDCGLAKERMHISHSNLNGASTSQGGMPPSSSVGIDTLTTRAISQSAASQRAGRAGREAEGGECYRLYPSSEYQAMAPTTVPEIHRTALSSVALDCFSAGVDPREVDWVEPPNEEKLRTAVLELAAMGAVAPGDEANSSASSLFLTDLGRKMALLPLPPRFSLLLLTAFQDHSVKTARQARDLVAILSSERSIFVEPSLHSAGPKPRDEDKKLDQVERLEEQRTSAEKARGLFRHRSGDHVTMLRALYRYRQVEADINKEKSEKISMDLPAFDRRKLERSLDAKLSTWCHQHYLSQRTLREIEDISRQLDRVCQRAGMNLRADVAEDIDVTQRNGSGSHKQRLHSPTEQTSEPEDDSEDALVVTRGSRAADEDASDDDKEDYTPLLQCLISPDRLSNIAYRRQGAYRVMGGSEVFKLHPTSTLHARNNAGGGGGTSELILFEELTYTTQLYARVASEVKMEWLTMGSGKQAS